MGTWQPPPSEAKTARSAVTAILVSLWSRVFVMCWAGPLSSRVSTASAPWPTAGHMTSGSRSSAMRFSQPSRRSPADARTIASYFPSSSFRRRVSILPRMFSTSRSGRSARSCAARRNELVPTRARCGRSDNLRPTNASRESSRSGIAPNVRPEGSSVGMSFRLCTATSIVPSSRASSISFVNNPLVPTLESATSVILSPVVWMISIRHCWPNASRRYGIQRPCHKASWAPREPMVSISVAETEDLSNNGDEKMSIGQRGLARQFRDGPVGDLVDHALGESFQRLFLLESERSELGAHAGELGGSPAFELFLQAHNRGHHFSRLEAGDHAIHFLADDRFGL